MLIVFGAMNVYAPPNPDMLGDPPSAAARSGGIANLMASLRDDSDTRRYFAYASAILGRPYDGYYVQTGDARTRPPDDAHKVVHPDLALLPWRDFTVEYPPGMLVAAIAPALFTSAFPTYHLLFSLMMEALLTACAWLCVRAAERLRPGAGRDALALSILFVAGLGVIGVRRYDALVALAIAIAAYGLVTRRPALTGLGIAFGTIVKATPLLLAPIAAIHWLRGRHFRELAVGALVIAIMGAVAAAGYGFVAGPRAFDILAYHVDRPVQVESPYGAILMLADAFHHGLARVVWGYGSDNVESTIEPALRQLSSIVLALSILGVFVWTWRVGDRLPDEPSRNRAALVAFTAVLIAFIGLGKVFSPQYLVWIFPTAVICAAVSSERSRLLLIGAAIMTQLEYPFIYHANVPFVSTLIAGVAICRDTLLVGCAVSLMSEASRAMEESAGEIRLTPPFTASP